MAWFSVRKSLTEYGDKLEAGEKDKIEAAIRTSKKPLKGEDKDDIEAKTNALMTASQKLGEKMYADMQAARPAAGAEGAAGAAGACRFRASQAADDNVVDAEFTKSRRTDLTEAPVFRGTGRVSFALMPRALSDLDPDPYIMAKRDFYEVPPRPAKGAAEDEIKKAYRKLAMKYHLTATRVTRPREAEEKFRRSKRPTRCSPTPRSVRPMTSSATPASTRTWVAAVVPVLAVAFADAFGDIFGDIFGQVAAAVVVAVALRSTVAATCRTPWKSPWKRLLLARTRKFAFPLGTNAKLCHGSGAKPGTSAKTRSTCKWLGTVHMRQGFFSVQQTCPHCRGSARSFPTLHGLPRPRQDQEDQDPGSQDSSRHQRRHAHSFSWQRRTWHQWRPGWRPLHRDPHQAARDFRARWRRPALHRARAADLGCAGGSIEVPTLVARPKSRFRKAHSTGKTFRLRGKGIKGCAPATLATCTATSR